VRRSLSIQMSGRNTVRPRVRRRRWLTSTFSVCTYARLIRKAIRSLSLLANQFATLYAWSFGMSYYNAGQLTLRHPSSHGLQFDLG
jgi:hypothetical protein